MNKKILFLLLFFIPAIVLSDGDLTIIGGGGGEVSDVEGISDYMETILDDEDEATFKATSNLEIGTDVLAQQTIGIADDNLVEIDDADAASGDYTRVTANGLEGRDPKTEMINDMGLGTSGGLLQFNLDSNDLTNGQYSGLTDSITAGVNLVLGDIVYQGASGKYLKSQADSSASTKAQYVVTETINADDTGIGLSYGYIKVDAWTTVQTNGGDVFIDDDTSGLPTTTQVSDVGDFSLKIGTCKGTDLLFFRPDNTVVEVIDYYTPSGLSDSSYYASAYDIALLTADEDIEFGEVCCRDGDNEMTLTNDESKDASNAFGLCIERNGIQADATGKFLVGRGWVYFTPWTTCGDDSVDVYAGDGGVPEIAYTANKWHTKIGKIIATDIVFFDFGNVTQTYVAP